MKNEFSEKELELFLYIKNYMIWDYYDPNYNTTTVTTLIKKLEVHVRGSMKQLKKVHFEDEIVEMETIKDLAIVD